MITSTQLSEILPYCANASDWTISLNNILPLYNITTNDQLCAFIAQCAVETDQFNNTIENLNYSADALVKIFPREFPSLAYAEEYARNQEKIANIVYAPPRLGNTFPDDGWNFRGRGLIQITGRSNYQKFADFMNMNINDTIPFLETKDGAVTAAAWYWKINNLNRFCHDDNTDFINLTKAINGATAGLNTRIDFWTKAKNIL